MYSFKYNQQDATFYNILYYCQALHVSGGFSGPLSGAQELNTQHLVCSRLACLLACLLAAAVSVVFPTQPR